MAGATRKKPTPDWVHRLQFALFRAAETVFLAFPPDWNLETARIMGWVWFKMFKRHRDRAIAHISLAFGERYSHAEKVRMARRSMQQMTMMAMELLFAPRRITEWSWPRHVRLVKLGPAVEALLADGGVIMMTAHYGNWELLGYMVATIGFDVHAVMRPLDNPYLNDYLEQTRGRRGLKLLYKKGATAQADQILDEGGTICFIADQDAGRKGIFVDFFGQPASTYKSIGLLAINRDTPIVVGYARRTSPRFEYDIGVNRVIHPHEWKSQDDPLRWLTQEYTKAIEEFVRADPDQYLWVHRRWKSEPRKRIARNERASRPIAEPARAGAQSSDGPPPLRGAPPAQR